MASDLPAAIIEKLRGNQALVTAIGENTASPSTVKFHADIAVGQPELPFAVYEEDPAEEQYMTQTGDQPPACLESGFIKFTIVAPGKKQARALGKLIVSTINIDNTVYQIDGCHLMNLRATRQFFVPVADVAPEHPTAYARVVVFDYMLQRSF